ncbi:MAG: 50S ribosomal protein L23 [Longicatena sp.]|jgi:large subunit ribosomal protein L23|nr:50S ribosomal protein L23 [Longicatena sp.]
MNNYRDIIIRPIVTEKTMRYMDEENKVTFEVKKGANKTLIKQAVEAIFGVNVEAVNVVNVKPKTKRVGRYVGKTKAVRKAYVKIKAGQEINLFGEAEAK